MKKALLIIAAAVAGMLAPGAAHAETPPGCASAQQIGSTAYVTVGGQTAASVKQFAGCGKNWGYVYVWADWAARHDLFHVVASVVTDDNREHGRVVGRVDQREVWSAPAGTVDRCTRALGVVKLGEDGWSAYSSRRC
ncbi:hypothetical protein SAMN05216188_107188 [Lentzea xinjiangensis]|uniref:Peptidase inhibitor family I36 n=1 Tax=Lentzea xinjiangensis TaxID=402600 RepID=A0A1H9KZI2_9PSEU|nr:hypothetical protein [Lentzea xinjiangensis]SER04602.1 hypothetical protein SAMN05216188_107188 [Lentzea xinjiangensis]